MKNLIVFDPDDTLAESNMLFIGDALIGVRDPHETKRVIETIVACRP